jgi:hypothetical protein
MGWYVGVTLHVLVNAQGELWAFRVTTGEGDDRAPGWQMAAELWGHL